MVKTTIIRFRYSIYSRHPPMTSYLFHPSFLHLCSLQVTPQRCRGKPNEDVADAHCCYRRLTFSISFPKKKSEHGRTWRRWPTWLNLHLTSISQIAYSARFHVSPVCLNILGLQTAAHVHAKAGGLWSIVLWAMRLFLCCCDHAFAAPGWVIGVHTHESSHCRKQYW